MVTPASTPTPEPVDPREARAERRRAAAERLGVIGMALAEAMLARFGDATNAGEPGEADALDVKF